MVHFRLGLGLETRDSSLQVVVVVVVVVVVLLRVVVVVHVVGGQLAPLGGRLAALQLRELLEEHLGELPLEDLVHPRPGRLLGLGPGLQDLVQVPSVARELLGQFRDGRRRNIAVAAP